MRLKLTLQRPDSTEDVLVTLDAAATVGDLADALLKKDPVENQQPFHGSPTIRSHGAANGQSAEARVLDPDLHVIESGLRSGFKVSLIDSPSQGAHAAPMPKGQAVALLRVLSGPEAGREFPLHDGANFVGRDQGNDVVLSGDSLVSKEHARISIGSAIDVVDLSSANGISIDGEQVQRAIITADNVVMIGNTAISVVPVRTLTGASDTSVDFNRPPLVRPIFEGTVLDAPEFPDKPKPFHFPILMMIAPLIMGCAMFAITRSPMSVVFIGLSPLLIIGSMLDQHRNQKKDVADQLEAFDEALVQLDENLAQLQHVEIESRLMESPSTAEAVDSAERLASTLWLRRPDLPGLMTVRFGLGSVPSRTQVNMSKPKATVPGAFERLQRIVSKYRYVDDVPVVGDFKSAGGLGVAGPEELSVGVARSLALQLACQHAPVELAITAVGGAGSSKEWEWLKWMPHVNSGYSPIQQGSLASSGPGVAAVVSELEELIGIRASASEKNKEEEEVVKDFPVVLLIVMDDAPIGRSRLVQIAENGPRVGVFVLWVATTIARIPACCRSFVELKVEGNSVAGHVKSGETVTPMVSETTDMTVATHVARRLSPVVDSGAKLEDDSDLPRSVSWLAAVGPELAESPDPIIERWRAGDPTFLNPEPRAYKKKISLRGAVGQAGGDTFHLDLRVHGPHGLVGGTTGAGKSEFLQSWVLGMAAQQSPKRLTFLFVDYKGGSAFANCLDLPHCVGLVTDLSPYLVRRALASFRAELHYRERILEAKGAKDLIDLERSGDPDAPPNLLIIVDEFAALVQEVPEFIDGVVDVGQRGRSLGLHLVLATQQPSGVIKGSLRANTNLRVALRMADVDDSMDVIGDKMAGGFDPTIPGRGAAKTGPGRITQFQSLYCGGITPEEPPRPSVDLESLSFGTGETWQAKDAEKNSNEADVGETDIARVVGQIIKANAQCEIPVPRKPWLPSLADTYDLARLEQRRDSVLVFGVEDDPDLQEHRQIAFRPDEDGNLAIFGTGGSGKSTLLRTLALSAAVTPRSGPCSVYGLDFGSRGLSMLEGLPHVGAVINGDDNERIQRLFRWLRDEIEVRSRRYAAVRAGTITEYRANANEPNEPRIIVMVDGMTNFREEYEMGRNSAWFTIFSQICSDGRPVGVHVIMTGDRPNTVPSSIGATVQQRVILRLADENDYAMVNAPSDVLTSDSPPGRCTFNGLEAQIATLGGSQNLATQSRAVEKLGEVLRKRDHHYAKLIESLPERVSLTELPEKVDGGLALGMRDDLLSPMGLRPAGTFLIIGPPASGRTTALASIIRSTRRAYPNARSYFFGNKRSQILGLDNWVESALDEDSTMDLAARLETDIKSDELAPSEDSPILIVLDNVSSFFSGMAEPALQEMVAAADSHDVFVIAEGETSTMTSSWALGTALRARRRGFALQPDDMDGTSIFRTDFPRMSRSEFPPGRGIMVDGGKLVRVQIALPE